MIKHITTDELIRLPVKEGLVLQGCGGDPAEWQDGINEVLTEAGILNKGKVFPDIYVFNHGELTNILFPFDQTMENLDMGKLAVWRLQHRADLGATWLSDYLPNYLGVEAIEADEPPYKPSVREQLATGEQGHHTDTQKAKKKTPSKEI